MKKKQDDLNKKCSTFTDMFIQYQKMLVEVIFKNKNNNEIQLPVAFSYIINNVKNQNNIQSNSMVDITPWEAFELIDNTYNNLEKIHFSKPNELFKAFYYFNLSPTELLMIKRYNRKALIYLLAQIEYYYKTSDQYLLLIMLLNSNNMKNIYLYHQTFLLF